MITPPGELFGLVLALFDGPVRRGSVGPKIATSGLPSAAAACIGPVSLVTINSHSRSHSTISGSEVSPHKFRQRAGAAREIISPSGWSSAPPRMAKRRSGTSIARRRTSSAKYSAGQRLFDQRAPG